jgi:hypothetical protein
MTAHAENRLSEKVAFGDVGDPFDQLDEAFERWRNRLTIDNLALSKRYLDGDLWIGVRFARIWHGVRTDYRAVLQGILTVGGANPNAGLLHHLPQCVHQIALSCGDQRADVQVNNGVSGPYRYEGLVFVQDVEAVDFPEGFVPTWVWLETLDEPEDDGIGNARAIAKPLGFEFGGVFIEGKVRIFPGPSAFNSELRGQEVQSRSQIVDHVANDCAQAVGDRLNRGGSVCLNRLADRISGPSAGFGPLREAVG